MGIAEERKKCTEWFLEARFGMFIHWGLYAIPGRGEWMKQNGKGIYQCGRSTLEKPEWGYFTQNDKLIYEHIFDGNIGALPIPGIKDSVKKARLLYDSSEIKLINAWNIKEYPDYAFINFGPESVYTYPHLMILTQLLNLRFARR